MGECGRPVDELMLRGLHFMELEWYRALCIAVRGAEKSVVLHDIYSST